ncbi:efflux RND transporter periplasmic adaptor subunit [Duganella callida]|uniref:Efflux RND transporter periplasmic adaptor subunit n=1 Tax=Duganella callida TaxID=2561932 RepID=A0A4Y9SRN9_9BURK|nr:efflux RND transporter periplasmic adaptor subunit [Duganella callida]TFW29271.1 efflux RND transporter periplasmic adaptor subunit [Duganella callida]
MKPIRLPLPPHSILGAAMLLSLAACSRPTTPPEGPAKVAWFTAAPADAGQASFTGVVHARTESNLGFRVAGKVVERLVDPGQSVRKGQPLMRIDPVDYELAAAAARAAVEAAQARQAQAVAEEARLRKLLATGAVSTQAYEQAKAAADSAIAQANAEAARARQTEHQRDYAVLLADMDGVVMEVPADAGQVVAAGQTVVRLARDGAREALVYLPENALTLAKQPASAALYSEAGQSFPATLRELASVADPQTRTYLARYTLSGAAAQAPLGATVTVRMDGTPQSQISVPVSALVDQGKGTGVWIIDGKNSTVSLRAVKVEKLGEEQAVLSQGLAPGERAVAYGGHLLKAGQKVSLLAAVRTGSGS